MTDNDHSDNCCRYRQCCQQPSRLLSIDRYRSRKKNDRNYRNVRANREKCRAGTDADTATDRMSERFCRAVPNRMRETNELTGSNCRTMQIAGTAAKMAVSRRIVSK